MPRVRISARRQITIPADTIERLGLETGEELEVLEHDNAIILVPRKHIEDDDQAWFWTKEWQERIRAAEADIDAGRVKTFDNVEDLIRDLNA